MRTCPQGIRPCTRCHRGIGHYHLLDHTRLKEFRPPGSAKRKRLDIARSDLSRHVATAQQDLLNWVDENHPTEEATAAIFGIMETLKVRVNDALDKEN